MDRTFPHLLVVALATALVSLPAAADGSDGRGARTVAPYRTHPLGPGPDYGPEADDPCRRLAAARWGADYVAGVDAYGRKVAPADLEPGPAADTAPIVAFDIPVPGRPGKARRRDMIAGTVTVDTATGLVELDGRPLNVSETAWLREFCLGR